MTGARPLAPSELAELLLGHRGRMISFSKSGYRARRPANAAIFKARVYVGEECVWYGDLDLTLDERLLARLADLSGLNVRVAYERHVGLEEPSEQDVVLELRPSGVERARFADYLERADDGTLRHRLLRHPRLRALARFLPTIRRLPSEPVRWRREFRRYEHRSPRGRGWLLDLAVPGLHVIAGWHRLWEGFDLGERSSWIELTCYWHLFGFEFGPRGYLQGSPHLHLPGSLRLFLPCSFTAGALSLYPGFSHGRPARLCRQEHCPQRWLLRFADLWKGGAR